jgi:hypothetical protein
LPLNIKLFSESNAQREGDCHFPVKGENNASRAKQEYQPMAAKRAFISFDYDHGAGLFSSLAADALEGGAADVLGHVTAPAIYAFVEGALGAWEQRPLFKSHVSKALPIRKCKPAVDLAILRDLPILFPVPAEDLPLSPEFEATCENKDEAKTRIFCKLQELSRVHLVVPVDAPHMYDAAMQSKACRLTPTGYPYGAILLAIGQE